MGWDAFSSVEWIEGTTTIKDKKIRKDFEEASKYVSDVAGCADGGLSHGMLDLSGCGHMLETLTGRSAWDSANPWNPELVKEMYDKITRQEVIEDECKEYYWSVRKFMELCAKHNLSIRFSY